MTSDLTDQKDQCLRMTLMQSKDIEMSNFLLYI